ncbi:MAG: hypothetical protein IKQ22_03680 [Clostridia bacterium]|nr:hypothetical protein [Clostridia bacterium]
MAREDKYTRDAIKEKVEISRNDLDLDTAADICTMIQETLFREAEKFTDVIKQLAKTYKKEFILGDFSVCLAVSDGVHDEPIVSLATGSIPGTLKNLRFMSKGVMEILHDKAAE